MKNKIILALIIAAVVIGEFFIVKQHYSKQPVTTGYDSVYVDSLNISIEYLNHDVNYLGNVIDSLNVELAKKPKLIIKKVPIEVFVRKDSLIKVNVPQYIPGKTDTVTVFSEVEVDNTLLPTQDQYSYGAETFVIGNDKKTVVKVNRNKLKEFESIYLVDGESMSTPLVAIHNKNALKRRIKFNMSSVYVLIVSNHEDIQSRMNSIITNRNKF